MNTQEKTAAELRVLMVSAFFSTHGVGIEVVAGRLAETLCSRWRAKVHWFAGGPIDELPSSPLPAGLAVERADSFDPLERRVGLPFPTWSARSIARLRRRVREADVVHVHDYLYISSLAAILFARIAAKPVVLTQHIGEIPFQSRSARRALAILNRTVGRWALAAADQVVFVGKPVQEYFTRFVRFRVPPQLISNGVDHTKYAPAARAARTDQPLRALFVGRFVEKKGIALLKDCVDLPATSWTFVGRGPLNPSRWPKSSATVNVIEHLRGNEVIPYFQQADLLVLPSTGEGFPLVVQEALACGTPVLVSQEVANAFPISDPTCVFAVNLRVADPVAALREAIRQVVDRRSALDLARACASQLASQWSWEKCGGSYMTIYRNLSMRGASSPGFAATDNR